MTAISETGALLGQLERLHREVRTIAEDMALIHNLEKTLGQKTNVIGRAMLEQKQATKTVTEQQKAVAEQITDCHNHADAQRQVLMQAVDDVVASIQQLRNLEDREDVLLKSLARLSKSQNTFMAANQSFAKTAEADLETVKTTVGEIKQKLSAMDVADQVSFMNQKAEDIQTAINSYISLRVKFTAKMDQQLQTAETKLHGMQCDMEKQQQAITKVAEISANCEQKTIEMCKKLEALLAEQKTPDETAELSLEDMFEPVSEPVSEPMETDTIEKTEEDGSGAYEELFEMMNTFDLEDDCGEDMENNTVNEPDANLEDEASSVDIPIPPQKPKQKAESLDLEDDPDFRFVGDVEPLVKKGFLHRIFGGR